MILKPDDSWMWKFDNTQSQLSLELGTEFVFQPHLKRNKLVAFHTQSMPFSVDDAAVYYQFLDQLSNTALPAAIKVYWILNAITGIRFHKPLMPQSWFFTPAVTSEQPIQGELVVLNAPAGGQAKYMVLESNSQTSLCMLVDENHQLNQCKQLQQFDLIKVMNDRVSLIEQAEPLRDVG